MSAPVKNLSPLYLPFKPVGVFHWLVVVTAVSYWESSPVWQGIIYTAFTLYTVMTWLLFFMANDWCSPLELVEAERAEREAKARDESAAARSAGRGT